ERAPGDAVARAVEAAHGPLQALDVRQQVVGRHEHVVHDDFAVDRRAERELALDLRRRQPLHTLLEDEAADDAVELRPYDEYVGDRRIGNPGLGARQPVPPVDAPRAPLHRAGVSTAHGAGAAAEA